MIVKNIEAKIRLATFLSLCSFILALVISVGASYFAYKQVSDSRKSIYVLQDGVNPFRAVRTDIELNRGAEYRAHISRFHSLFFSLIPDEHFIESQMRQAMYLIDESGAAEYNNLKERSFFSSVLSSSAVLTLQMDSILVDEKKGYFKYYGTQRIDRKSVVTIRALITEGHLRDLPSRSEHNPHAVLITSWKTLDNSERSSVEKNQF
ncbi:conjugative transposon protein TraK [Pedobacter aquatilis]|uniref:conjugative transposon protein TraK n=1 Tax=Pedobacter aquatilis TaxID=351343 RepID=UPI0025B3196B|nr:conjugative transposon protein TraK [Pedobacter aquatilis]MDN3586164.1 conjugative transposon protein TraK [Pedobacter aquatilis]